MNTQKQHHLKFSLLILLGTALLFPLSSIMAQADYEIGSIIVDFEQPEQDENGQLRLKIFGKEATIITKNRIEVRNLKIELYENNEVQTTLTSPLSDFWKLEKKLTSDKGVHISRHGMNIKADTMEWGIDKNEGFFKGNVRVTLPNRDQLIK